MYYYCICKKYHTYYSKIIEDHLKTLDEWKRTKYKNKAHYCDCRWFGKIKYKIPFTIHIFYKHNLARVLGNSNIHPKTFIVSRRIIIDKRYRSTIKNENRNKWFLKPVLGCGGNGIKVLSKMSDWRKYADKRKVYVLQKGIESILYNNKKFDIRTYLLAITTKKKLYLYISKDSCMRISSYDYNKTNNKSVNITNLSFQGKNKNKEKNCMALSRWEHYDEVFPKMKTLINQFGLLIDRYAKKIPAVSYLGIDIIINKNKEPKILEINNNIGVSAIIRPKGSDRNITHDIIRDMINVGYVPLINNKEPPIETEYWTRCY